MDARNLAAVMVATGVYQCFYGLSEKYRKHVTKAGNSINNKLLHLTGKIGYLVRGIVWLLIAWMFLKAALHANSSEAGDTSEAFSFLASAAYGAYLVAFMGLGWCIMACSTLYVHVSRNSDTM